MTNAGATSSKSAGGEAGMECQSAIARIAQIAKEQCLFGHRVELSSARWHACCSFVGKDDSMNTPTPHLAVALLAASAFPTHSQLRATSTHASANAVAVVVFAALLAIGIASALALLDGARLPLPPSD